LKNLGLKIFDLVGINSFSVTTYPIKSNGTAVINVSVFIVQVTELSAVQNTRGLGSDSGGIS
jgi:hypothetical protein